MQINHIKQVDYLKLNKTVNLTAPAGNAKLSPPVGPILGQAKIKVKDFCTAFNEATKEFQIDFPLKVSVFVYKNDSFDFIVWGPSTNLLINSYLNKKKRKSLTLLEIYKIALVKKLELKNESIHLIIRNILAILKRRKINIEN